MVSLTIALNDNDRCHTGWRAVRLGHFATTVTAAVFLVMIHLGYCRGLIKAGVVFTCDESRSCAGWYQIPFPLLISIAVQ
jgi:hypothetical protein